MSILLITYNHVTLKLSRYHLVNLIKVGPWFRLSGFRLGVRSVNKTRIKGLMKFVPEGIG